MNALQHAKAADVLQQSIYVDDIVESTESKEQAVELAKETEEVLSSAGFKVKSWTFNKEEPQSEDTTQVLGVNWNPGQDKIIF